MRDFHPAQPVSNNQKNQAADGRHPGIKSSDDEKLPSDGIPDDVTNPESNPSQDEIKKQFFQTAAS